MTPRVRWGQACHAPHVFSNNKAILQDPFWFRSLDAHRGQNVRKTAATAPAHQPAMSPSIYLSMCRGIPFANVALVLALLATTGAPAPPPATLEFDHVWITVSPNATERVALDRAGLLVSPDVNVHEGQGTASITVEFENAFLELLWVDSAAPLAPGLERVTDKFRQRTLWRTSGWCPIGIGLRRTTSSDSALPFATWSATAPWMPPGSSIEMLTPRDDTQSPSLFISPRAFSAASEQAARASQFHHPLGVHRVTGIRLVAPKRYKPIEPLAYLQAQRILRLDYGDEWMVELIMDGGKRGKAKDLRPDLPLIIQY